MSVKTTLLRDRVGSVAQGMAILAALSAAVLLLLWVSGHLSSSVYETFLNKQEIILRTALWICITAIFAVPLSLIGSGKRIATITIAALTLVPMVPFIFIVSMARF